MTQDDADYLADYLARSVGAAAALSADTGLHAILEEMARITVDSIEAGGKLLIAGNGGSASDAQHIAGEMIGRLMYDRVPLPAIALTADMAVLTATANDYGFEHIFARQVAALGRPGDILLGISTSGRSANVLRALEVARDRGIRCFGFTGGAGGALSGLCDKLLRAPAQETWIIQQCHITAAHVLCALVERALCPSP